MRDPHVCSFVSCNNEVDEAKVHLFAYFLINGKTVCAFSTYMMKIICCGVMDGFL